MVHSQQNRFRIFLDTWLARIGSLFGWAWMVFWGLIGLVGFGEIFIEGPEDALDIVMPFLCLFLAFLHFLLIRSARITKQLIADFRVYCAIFAKEPDKSIPEMAKTVNAPLSAVQDQLKKMCRRGYFNGYIDYQSQRMVFPGGETDGGDVTILHCPGCGAPNAVSDKGGTCRYCDAPLTSPSHLNA